MNPVRITPQHAAAYRSLMLSGVAGLSFEPRDKAKLKATLFGMYVRDSCRQIVLGCQLVDQS
jgi:hypothetical protein